MPSGKSVPRRNYPRREFSREIGVLFAGEYRICRGVEIGEGGLSFRARKADFIDMIVSEKEDQPGSQVALTFCLSEEEKISVVRARARSAKVEGEDLVIGCRFEDLSFLEKRVIRTFVTTSAQKKEAQKKDLKKKVISKEKTQFQFGQPPKAEEAELRAEARGDLNHPEGIKREKTAA